MTWEGACAMSEGGAKTPELRAEWGREHSCERFVAHRKPHKLPCSDMVSARSIYNEA